MDGKYLVKNLKDLQYFKNIIKNEILEDTYNNFFNMNNDKFIEYLEKYKSYKKIDITKISTDIFNVTSRDKLNKDNIYKHSNYHTKFESKSNDIEGLITLILKNHLNYNEQLDENQIQYIYLMLAPSKSTGTGNITSDTRNSGYFNLSDIFNFIYGEKIQWLQKVTKFGMNIIENTNKFNFMFLNFNKPIKELQSTNKEMGFIFPIDNDELIKSIINATLLFEFIELTVDYIKDEDFTLFNVNTKKTKYELIDIFKYIHRENFSYLISHSTNAKKGHRKKNNTNVQLHLIKDTENEKINKFFCLANDYEEEKITELYSNLYYHPLMINPKNHIIDSFIDKKKLNNKLYSSYNIGTKSLQTICNNIPPYNIDDNIFKSESSNKYAINTLLLKSDIICLQEVNLNSDFTYKPIKKINVLMHDDFKEKKGYNSKNIKEFLNTNNIVYSKKTKNFSINVNQITIKDIFRNKNMIFVSNRLAAYQEDLNNVNFIKKFNVTLFPESLKLEDDSVFIGKIGNGWNFNTLHTFMAIKINNDDCIINLHLDTNDSKRIKQTELEILLNKIISKYYFFYKFKRIIIAGDFNMDQQEIIEVIYTKIRSSFYINKKFRILFNNIITGNTTALDNCIIIEENYETNKCNNKDNDYYEPEIYVTANKFNVHADSLKLKKKKSKKINDAKKQKLTEKEAKKQILTEEDETYKDVTNKYIKIDKKKFLALNEASDFLEKLNYKRENKDQKENQDQENPFFQHERFSLSDHSLISFYINDEESHSKLKKIKKRKRIKKNGSIDDKSSKTNSNSNSNKSDEMELEEDVIDEEKLYDVKLLADIKKKKVLKKSDNKSSKTNSIENNSNNSESSIQDADDLLIDKINTKKYKVIQTNEDIDEIINIYLMNYNKFFKFIMCLSKTTAILSLDFIDFSLENKINKSDLRLNKLKKTLNIDLEVNYLVQYPQLENQLVNENKKEEIQLKLIGYNTNPSKINHKLQKAVENLSQIRAKKIELESKIKIFKPIYLYFKSIKKLEEDKKKLDEQNEKILNLKNNDDIKILLNELINDFKTSSNTDEEKIYKKIFSKCNIKLFRNKKKNIDNELKLNDLCLIKQNIDSKINYSLINKIK
jgi:hypothetical protein